MENPKIIKMNMIQAEFGVIPSIVKKENREEYIKSLVASQEEGNPNSFIEFMLKHHIANLEKTITEYNHSIENDTLNLENDTLNDTLNLSEKETLILNLINLLGLKLLCAIIFQFYVPTFIQTNLNLTN